MPRLRPAAMPVLVAGLLMAAAPVRAADTPAPTAAEAATALPQAPLTSEDLIGAAEDAMDAGRRVQAATLLVRLAQDEEMRDAPRFRILQAEMALSEERPQDAIAQLEPLVRAEGENCRLSQMLGSAYLRTGRSEDALPLLQAAVRQCPERWQAWEALAIAHDARGDWQASAAAFETAFRLTDRPARVANNYGYSLLRQKRAAEAANLFTEAARRDPSNPRYRNNEDMARVTAGLPLLGLGENETPDMTAARLANAAQVARASGQEGLARLYASQAMNTADTFNAIRALDQTAPTQPATDTPQ